MENGQRRYQIYLSNEGGPPIDVYVVSPYSDGPVSSEDWVAQPLPPSSPLPLSQVLTISPHASFSHLILTICIGLIPSLPAALYGS